MRVIDRHVLPLGVVVIAALATGCGSDSRSPTSPSASGGATIQGVISQLSQASSLGALRVSGDDMHVEVVGTDLIARVESDGEFRLTSVPASSEVRLRFVSDDVDDTISIRDVDDGDVVTLMVSLLGTDVVVDREERDSSDDECTAALSSMTFEKVIVPDGATCTMTGTTVRGNVHVETGATLIATSVMVGGNVQADGHASVELTDASNVNGNVQLKRGGGVTVSGATIGGNLQVERNVGASTLDDNTVGGNVQASQNVGGLVIRFNRIDGNLQCRENNPAPTVSGNTAAQKEDQCASL